VFILARALVWSTLTVGFGLVFLPSWLLDRSGIVRPAASGLAQAGGIVLVITGGVLVLISVLTFVFVGRGTPAPFDPPRRLVVSGPFRYVRNPIYVGAVMSMLGAALFYRSIGLAVYAAVLAIGFHILVLAYEEPTLRRMFGDDYTAYCRRVGRWGWPHD
jgi:protein-S-isoprenylcysteine O-methyltransferase Ste14